MATIILNHALVGTLQRSKEAGMEPHGEARESQGKTTDEAVAERAVSREEAVAQSRDLDALLEAFTEPMVVYDTQTHIVRANAAFETLLETFSHAPTDATLQDREDGFALRDLQGELLPDEEWPRRRMLSGETISHADPAQILARGVSGVEAFFHVTGGPLYRAGTIIGAVAFFHDITEQRQREVAAQAEAEQLSAVLTAMSDAVLIADVRGQITLVNPAYRALVGLPLDQEVPGDPAAHIAELDIRDHNGQPVPLDEMVTQRALRGERIQNEAAVDYQFRTLDGEDRWVSATAAPLYDAQGQISGAITVLRDVTERRQAEHALQRANERFHLAERAANGFVYEWDVRAGVISRSAGVERLLGYRAEEIPPTWEAWTQLVYPGDWQASTDAEELAYLEALPSETLETEYRIRHRDGYYLTVADYALLERDAAGHIVRIIGQTHDISERKRAEEAVRSSEERLRLLIERAEDYSIFTTDERGVIDSWNEGARRMFGWSAEEIIGQSTERLFTPEDRAAGVPAQELETARQTGRAPDERFHLRKNGSRFYVSGTMAPLRHRDKLRGFVKIARDLTERKAAEEALRLAHDELEQRVVERTRELDSATRSLRRLSQRILEVQEGERRLIARELHDEIGQQLTGMKMLLDSLDEQLHEELREGPRDAADTPHADLQVPTPIEQLTEIRAVVGDTLESVRNLSLDLRPAVLDSLGLLPALRWMFERYTNQTGVEVDFAADGLDQRLPTQLEAGVYRLIQEALTNVARYAGVSAVTVQVYATDETLSLFIVDAGRGFDVESVLAASTSTGLAGMRERAALLGGSLSIDSLPGEGTTIQADFSIPHAIEEAAHRETAEDEEYRGWRTSQDDAARHRARDEARDRERDQWRDAARDVRRDAMRDTRRDTRRDALRDTSRDALHDADWGALRDRQARRREEETP